MDPSSFFIDSQKEQFTMKTFPFLSCGSTLHLDDVIRVILTLFVNVELVSNKLLRIFRILSVLRKRTRPKMEMASQD